MDTEIGQLDVGQDRRMLAESRSLKVGHSIRCLFQIMIMNATNADQIVKPADYGYLILLVLPVVTVCGNILVILAVMRNLQLKQSVTNRFISALAFCDLVVGTFVMPFAVYVKVSTIEFLKILSWRC